jgi:hypothetical protein
MLYEERIFTLALLENRFVSIIYLSTLFVFMKESGRWDQILLNDSSMSMIIGITITLYILSLSVF